MALIAARGHMQKAAVVPHHQHLGLPFMAVNKFITALPLVQRVKQFGALIGGHVDDGFDIASGAEKAELSCLRVRPHQGMDMGRLGGGRWPNVHTAIAGFIGLTIFALRGIGGGGRMNRHFAVDPRPQVARQLRIGQMLVCK